MSIFGHTFAIAASEPKGANRHHHEAIIADLHVWVEDLRQSNAQPLRPPEIVAPGSPVTEGHHGSATIDLWVSMRACARVALVLMAVSASFSLAACGAVEDLRDVASRWFDVGSPGRPGSADTPPHAPPMIIHEKSLKNEASNASKRQAS
jgi:hypothetical protein